MTGDTGNQQHLGSDDNGEGSARSLAIINAELTETIRLAHLALEDCVDGRGGTAALVRAGELLHQARGALQISETYGAALLVEEMELACKYLSALRAGAGREDGFDALTRSMVQLPIYIESLLAGGRDIALVLLPMLNDLRAVRGEPLLSEGTLLLLNLSPNRKEDRARDRIGDGQDPVLLARRLRPKFQLALLGWIKGGDNRRHLETLSSVADAFEAAATRDDMHQLWWVVGGVLESLQNGGLETSIAIKRLLGQADRQVKRVIDEGLAAYDKHPVDDLLNNLLYYVARSSNAGERISDIRAAFNLEELLPGDEQVEQAREALSAPSVRLMETVGTAIREDLGRVKDVLDIFVRTGMNKPADLVPQLDLLKKISDTLGVLGLGQLRGDINGEIGHLKDIVAQGGASSDQVILDIASTLLRVEDRLDQQLLKLTVPRQTDVDAGDAAANDDDHFQKIAESVMRECIINLARIKETITQSMSAAAPSQGLDSVPSLIQCIKAGLLMLEKPRAMEIVERIGRLVTAMLNSSDPSQMMQSETDRLADAIVSLEYYMETVKAGRSEPWYMLDNAEACLDVLRKAEQRLLQAKPPVHTEPVKTLIMSASEIAEQIKSGRHAVTPPPAPTEIIPLPVFSPSTEQLDPELLELFIEEAKEEVASIKRRLPDWIETPDDMELLITVRRSFHTLKGSGRMVGAERIGEYCWAIENLLNRLINRTLTRTPPMVDFVLRAATAVPELIEQLEVGTEPAADINLLIVQANAFADGDPNAALLTAAKPAGEAETVDEVPLDMDPVLYDIFAKETAGHVNVIADYIAACTEHQPPFEVTDKLYRACHTLHGSANMANVERGVAVTAALNRFVRHVHDHKVGFQQSGIDALGAAANAIKRIVADINNPDREDTDFGDLIERLSILCDELQPQEVDDTPTQTRIEPAVETAPATVVEDGFDEEEFDEPGYDAEIAAIFTEESAELLEAAEKALLQWVKERSAQPMGELRRHLHTLKGGARMAGISAMGNLSHEIETLLISVDDRRVKATPAVEDLLQRSIDELNRMRDAVIAGRPVRAAPELEQRIQQANAGFEIIDEHEVELELAERHYDDTPHGEFTSEPDDAVSMIIVNSPILEQLQADRERQAQKAAEAESLSALESGVEPGAEPEAAEGPRFEPEDAPAPETETELEAGPAPETEPELEHEPEAEPEL
ncbi:MAG: Hpt domain-containing protein, partial [Woeseiaceae bacterium]